MVMGRGEKVWPLLKHRPDPTMRSFLMERLGPGGVDSRMLTVRLDEEHVVSVRRAILLSLGEFGLDRLSLAERQNLFPQMLQVYRNDPDPGIHAAVEWLLRHWHAQGQLEEIAQELREWESGRQARVVRQSATSNHDDRS